MYGLRDEQQLCMELINTGPVTRDELRRFGTSLINESLSGSEISPSEVDAVIDELTGLGFIGSTGIKNEVLVLSCTGAIELDIARL